MSEPITDIHLRFPWGQTIEFPDHRPLSHGMRLSTHCPVQRVAEHWEADLGVPFDPGVGAIGYLYAFLWCRQTRQWQECPACNGGGAEATDDGEIDCLRCKPYWGDNGGPFPCMIPVSDMLEVPVPWKHGISHIDRVIPAGDNLGVYEIKSSSDKVLKPKDTTIAQMMRQMGACAGSERHAHLLDLPWYNVIIGKAGNESGWVRGPWEVTLDDEAPVKVSGEVVSGREYVEWDLEATTKVDALIRRNGTMSVADIVGNPDMVGDYCACGQHRLPPPVDVRDPALQEVAREYLASREKEKHHKDVKAGGLSVLRAAAATWEPGRYDVDDVRVTVNDEGKVTIR